MKWPMVTFLRIRSLRIKMTLRMKLLTTMDLSTNGREKAILHNLIHNLILLLRFKTTENTSIFKDNTKCTSPRWPCKSYPVMRLPTVILPKTNNSKIKTTQKMKLSTIMVSLTNGKEEVILPNFTPQMIGTTTLALMPIKKHETMLHHIVLMKDGQTILLSGVKTISCQDP